MTIVNQITIDGENINISKIEARAHKIRADAMAEYGHNLHAWFKSLDFGFAARAAH